MVAFPVPIGPGTSFSDLAPQKASAAFGIASGNGYTVTFNPVDISDPGTLTLYDSSNVAVLVMNQGGSYGFSTPAGTGFYFKGTKGARNASVIEPSIVY